MVSRSLVTVICSLTLVQLIFASYNILSKQALNTGLDPGVFTIIRDSLCAVGLNILAKFYSKNKRCDLRPANDADHATFILLGTFGMYFGQYFGTIGVKYGTSLLYATWSNSAPLITYVYGLAIGAEIFRCRKSEFLKIIGLVLAVGGAIGVAIATGNSSKQSEIENENTQNSTNLVLSSIFFFLQVFFGYAVFWHLQKKMLNKYSPIQVTAWFYSYGVVVLALTIFPHVLYVSLWTFTREDVIALLFSIAVWPLAAFLLTFVNSRSSPVMVMSFGPLQIVAVNILEYFVNGEIPSKYEIVTSGLVVLGLACFVSAVVAEKGGDNNVDEYNYYREEENQNISENSLDSTEKPLPPEEPLIQL